MYSKQVLSLEALVHAAFNGNFPSMPTTARFFESSPLGLLPLDSSLPIGNNKISKNDDKNYKNDAEASKIRSNDTKNN